MDEGGEERWDDGQERSQGVEPPSLAPHPAGGRRGRRRGKVFGALRGVFGFDGRLRVQGNRSMLDGHTGREETKVPRTTYRCRALPGGWQAKSVTVASGVGFTMWTSLGVTISNPVMW